MCKDKLLPLNPWDGSTHRTASVLDMHYMFANVIN